MKVGLTSGCFDLFHHSHLLYLERCKARCDKLIVGVDSDHWVSQNKGPDRPIHGELHRLNLINSLSCVSQAFLLRDVQQLRIIARDFNVDEIYKCEKFADGRHVHGTEHAKLVIIPDVLGMISTTKIIEKIREGEVEEPIPIFEETPDYDDEFQDAGTPSTMSGRLSIPKKRPPKSHE